MSLVLYTTKAVIRCKDGRGEIVNLANGRVLFQGNNIEFIKLSSADTKAVIQYKDSRKEIIDLQEEE